MAAADTWKTWFLSYVPFTRQHVVRDGLEELHETAVGNHQHDKFRQFKACAMKPGTCSCEDMWFMAETINRSHWFSTRVGNMIDVTCRATKEDAPR